MLIIPIMTMMITIILVIIIIMIIMITNTVQSWRERASRPGPSETQTLTMFLIQSIAYLVA